MTTFVTAIYGYGLNSLFGGRGRNIHFFDTSLRNISNIGNPIVVYTTPEDVQVVESFISRYSTQYKVIPYELEQFEFSATFLEYKKKIFNSITLNDRNEVLCYSKAYWVKDAIEKNYFNSDCYLWIDSGLTHHGIIPEKVGGVELMQKIPQTHYYPQNQNNIFSPKLGKNIDTILQNNNNKLLFCALPYQGSTDIIHRGISRLYNKTFPSIHDHLIGGIFGGDKNVFIEFFNHYRHILSYFIEKHIHVLEEPIFSCLNVVHPELFNLHKFYTWHFYVPGERCSMLGEDGDSFYKIFTKIYNLA
jgi:hypothetical protein